jgi:hypothetical protein
MQTFGLTSRRTPLPNRCFARLRRAFTLISVALETIQNLEFWRYKRQNSTLQAQKKPKKSTI